MTTPSHDFTRPRNAVTFRIDDDVFHAAPDLPARTLVEFVARYESFSAEATTVVDRLDALLNLLKMVLHRASYDLIYDRAGSTERPVTLEQLADVVLTLLEVYGLRPTKLSGNSAGGSSAPEPGTGSTESTPPAASISSPSPQTAS